MYPTLPAVHLATRKNLVIPLDSRQDWGNMSSHQVHETSNQLQHLCSLSFERAQLW